MEVFSLDVGTAEDLQKIVEKNNLYGVRLDACCLDRLRN